MANDLLTSESGKILMPDSFRQLGDYELDLLKCCYFGWMNSLSLCVNFWQQQLLPLDE